MTLRAPRTWRIANGALLEEAHDLDDARDPALFESFAVCDGAVVAFERHASRFADALAATATDATNALDAFLTLAISALATETGFPRLEFLRLDDNAPAFRLRRRPLGDAEPDEAVVLVGPPGDPRVAPRRKGVDQAWLRDRHNDALGAGADEWLIRDASGQPLEGAYSALLWWRGDTIYALPDDAAALPSVTRSVLLELAAKRGIPVRHEWPDLETLIASDTWLVNARHGIRRVVAWRREGKNLPAATTDATRRADWQKRWLARRAPLLQWSDRSPNHGR